MDFLNQFFTTQDNTESSPTPATSTDDSALTTTPANEHIKALDDEQWASAASWDQVAELDVAVINIKESPITRNRPLHIEIAESLDINNFPEEILNVIAMCCPHDTLISLSELGIMPAIHWVTFALRGPAFDTQFGGVSAPFLWEFMGGITTGVVLSDEEFDRQLVADIRYDWQIQFPEIVTFSDHVLNRKDGESCTQRFCYQSMCVWFEEHVGPTRGLYHFLRHVCGLSVHQIVTMTPGEVLDRLDTVPRGFDELYAACFYGLNGLACLMFEEMSLDELAFVGKWENALSGEDAGYFGIDNAHKNEFEKVKLMWGNDIFAYIYAHGNWKLARDISRRYGRQDYGIVWRMSEVESIFVNSLGVLLDTINLAPWKNFLEERFLDHFVNQGSPLFALSDLFLSATDAGRFHKMVSLLQLTGSAGVRRLVEERFDSEFGVKQLRLLEKTLYENGWIRASVRRQDDEGWEVRGGRGHGHEALRYPYEGVEEDLKKSEVLSEQRWAHVREYLGVAGYFEEHSNLHTKVFRVVAEMV